MGRHKKLEDSRKIAYEMYIAGHPLSYIASHTGISVETLKNWAYRGSTTDAPWRDVRKREYNDRLLQVLENDIASLEEIFSFGLNTIKRSLARMEIDNRALDENGLNKLAGVLEKVLAWGRANQEKTEQLTDEEKAESLEQERSKHPFFQESDS